jgi:MoxR-like ATPase
MSEDFLATFKGLVFQIRSEGIGLSDRRVVKLLKVFAASAVFDGREQVNDADLFILRHVWNTPEQEEILQEIVGPVLDRWYESTPNTAASAPHRPACKTCSRSSASSARP